MNNLRYANDTTVMAENEELKSLLMKVKEESEKVGLNSTLHANRWRNNGNSDRLYLGGSKITADGDCSQEIKRLLLLGKKL